MGKDVAIIGCAGIPANYGGFETLAENLVTELNQDFNFIVYCSTHSYASRKKTYKNAHLIYIPFKANGQSSILYDIVSIIHSTNKAGTLLVLGVGGAFLFPFIRLFTNKIIIVNIDGLEWKRQKWGAFARFYLSVQERIAMWSAHRVIADNEAIQHYISSKYKRESFYIPYGGDHTEPQSLSQITCEALNISKGGYCFTVCRIEPENNIHTILEAFAQTSTMKIIVVGNWKTSRYGKTLIDSYRSSTNIILLDPIYDLLKLDELRSNCSLYVHGHSAGGTNPSLVEAMNLGLAIVAWDVDYNRYTTDNKAFYFKNSSELTQLLRKVERGEFDLALQGSLLAKIAKAKFSWANVAKRYKDIMLI